LILPGIAALAIGDAIWPGGRRKFPDELALPRWFDFQLMHEWRVAYPPAYVDDLLNDGQPLDDDPTAGDDPDRRARAQERQSAGRPSRTRESRE
jgi:hypothetical protein